MHTESIISHFKLKSITVIHRPDQSLTLAGELLLVVAFEGALEKRSSMEVVFERVKRSPRLMVVAVAL